MAEGGKRINLNIELVNSSIAIDFDRPNGIAIFDYYFVDESVHVGRKK